MFDEQGINFVLTCSALFEPSNSVSSEDENESEGSLRSPASPGAWSIASKPINYHSLSPLPLLGKLKF